MNISLLDAKQHERSNFSCEEKSLTDYLQKQANQDVKKRLVVCFVLLDENNQIKGYYTLSSESLPRNTVPAKYQKKIPVNYNVPVTLLGRLARDASVKSTGAGERLLLDALHRSYKTSLQAIGSMAVVVDPISDNAVKFYEKYGFTMLPDSGRMFLPMNAIAKLFK